VQIDVVGLRDDNWTDLGECKWGAIRSYKKLLEEVERKVQAYPNNRGATLGKRIFLKNKPGFKLKSISDVRCYSLEDLYG
jgi:hypothetical protein